MSVLWVVGTITGWLATAVLIAAVFGQMVSDRHERQEAARQWECLACGATFASRSDWEAHWPSLRRGGGGYPPY